MNLITKKLSKFIDAVGLCCAVLMILMLSNVFYDVVMRYLFNTVSIAMQELEWHLFAAMFMFGIGYTLKDDGHVRVDVFFERMSVKSKALINILGALIFTIPFSMLILYYSFDYSMEAFIINEGSGDPGGLPYRWVIRSVIPLSALFLILCTVNVILVEIQKLTLVGQGVEK